MQRLLVEKKDSEEKEGEIREEKDKITYVYLLTIVTYCKTDPK